MCVRGSCTRARFIGLRVVSQSDMLLHVNVCAGEEEEQGRAGRAEEGGSDLLQQAAESQQDEPNIRLNITVH